MDEMVDEVKQDTNSRMRGAMDALNHDLAAIRTGRASPALVERMQVDYYGTMTPLNQIAGITVPEARLLVIQPWDKGAFQAIERAIMQSDLGLTPNNDGIVIRLPIPQLTEDRRLELVRIVRAKVEEAKISVRNVRRDAMEHVKELEREKMIGEDDERRAESEIQSITDQFVARADDIGQAKEVEVLEV